MILRNVFFLLRGRAAGVTVIICAMGHCRACKWMAGSAGRLCISACPDRSPLPVTSITLPAHMMSGALEHHTSIAPWPHVCHCHNHIHLPLPQIFPVARCSLASLACSGEGQCTATHPGVIVCCHFPHLPTFALIVTTSAAPHVPTGQLTQWDSPHKQLAPASSHPDKRAVHQL